jgi:hypothetical protein
MTTLYGSGKNIDKDFFNLAMMVGGAYKPNITKGDRILTNVTKLATTACVSFRINTALKQMLSYPAFHGEAAASRLALNAARPKYCLTWAMNNLPAIDRRWTSRGAGNEILRDWDGDWNWTQSGLVKKLSRFGMTTNAFVDLVTCSMGAEAVYQNKMKEYTKWMKMSKEEAHERAIIDAEIVFNLSQQSSELPYLSELQNNHSYVTTILTPFRNASMAYTRQGIQTIREGINMAKNKEEQIEFETKKAIRAGMDDADARAYAHHKYNANKARLVKKLVQFGWGLSALWSLGGSGIYYLIFGKDDEKKKDLIAEAAKRGSLSMLEGFSTGGTVPDLIYQALNGQSYSFSEESTPALGLLSDVINACGNNDWITASEMVAQYAPIFFTGVNPQIFEDIITAGMDLYECDDTAWRDYAMFAMRFIQVPQSQVDMVYFDELGCTAKEAQRMTPKEVAQRYATYKLSRGDFFTHGVYGDDTYNDREQKQIARAKSIIKETIAEQWTKDVNDKYDQADKASQAIGKKLNRIKADESLSPEQKARETAEITKMPEYKFYRFFHPDSGKSRKAKFENTIQKYLDSKTPEEANEYLQQVIAMKPIMVDILYADTDEEREAAKAKWRELTQR